jgi:uncharacterized membrane protein
MEKSSTGANANTAAGLAVLFGWVGGLIFLLVEKSSAYVKFYALQSIAVSVLWGAVGSISFVVGLMPMPALAQIKSLLQSIIVFLPLVLWVILLINAFSGKIFELPLIGKWCRQQAGL